MNLILVRHGEISSNIEKVYAGRSSEGLTERGIEQAHEVADKMDVCHINALYTSPIRRAVQTAEIISSRIGRGYIIEENFREMELGPWEGLSEGEIARRYPEEWQIWNSRPAELSLQGRETLTALLKRILVGVQNIQQRKSGHTVVIVTHVAIIRVLLLWHEKKSLNYYKTVTVPNAGVFCIEIV